MANQHLRKEKIYDGIVTPEKRNSGIVQSIRNGLNKCENENITFYLKTSSLHGLKYIGENQLSWAERSFFGMAFTLVLIISGFYITNIYQKWTTTPIIITLSSELIPIRDIPFPAVTICNMNQARRSIVEQLHPLKNAAEFYLLSSVCSKGESQMVKPNLSMRASKWSAYRNFLLNVSQSCDDLLIKCAFANYVYDCLDLFDSVLTDDGLCCTFNNVHPKYLIHEYDDDDLIFRKNTGNLTPIDWTPETGYSNLQQDDNKIYPRPSAGEGSNMGLYLVVDANISDYYCSSTSSSGLKVLLHNPTETPKMADYGFALACGHESRIVIKPKITYASKAIRNIPIDKRQCVFSDEILLKYFRTYSRKNCRMECESQLILKECGCVLYYMPRLFDSVRICSLLTDRACYMNVKLIASNSSKLCECLPNCFEINFGYITTASPLIKAIKPREHFFKNLTNKRITVDLAIIQIFYEKSVLQSFNREEFIGFTEFLSNTGGLLGLFMGFSVLSIIEIIYFVTLRPYYENKRDLQKKQHKKNFKFREKRFSSIQYINHATLIDNPWKIKKNESLFYIN